MSDFESLIGKQIIQIFINADKTLLKFFTKNQQPPIYYRADAACCSE